MVLEPKGLVSCNCINRGDILGSGAFRARYASLIAAIIVSARRERRMNCRGSAAERELPRYTLVSRFDD